MLAVVHANFVFSVPAPTAALSDWIAAPGRTTVSLNANNVSLRGWLYPSGSTSAPTVLVFGGIASSLQSVVTQRLSSLAFLCDCCIIMQMIGLIRREWTAAPALLKTTGLEPPEIANMLMLAERLTAQTADQLRTPW